MGVDYDVLVIGSGFGGSVAALRLTEKGYRVGVLEAGRRFADEDFAKTSWRVRDYLWAPALGCYGIMRITPLRKTLILSGSGVGGGSLVYANTLYEPPAQFFADPQWAHITDWQDELGPYYDQAKRMLGVTINPRETSADKVMHEVADDLGVGDTYRLTPVGVFFGDQDSRPGDAADDPYFGGEGPERNSCVHCGQCMVGCRHNAKNTLMKNYLHLAERAGARIFPLTTVTSVRPLPDGGYAVDTVKTGRTSSRRTFLADQVVFAAAALGTQRLLHHLKDTGTLPRISDRLGVLTRTNSEAILGARSLNADTDFSEGVAITSSIHPDPVTHVEMVRYGRGSNLMSLLQTVLADPIPGKPRIWAIVREMMRGWRTLPAAQNPRHWSERTMIMLVMQTLNNSITTYTRAGIFGRRMTSEQGAGEPNPSWLPVGHDVTRRVAGKIGGIAGGSWADAANMNLTAHFIGGCVIGDSSASGVVDPYHRMYGHEGLHIMDSSTISANLGVNPSLTITAQAERAVALWPNKGAEDRRPPLGSRYRRLAPVAPANPVVPWHAPAALRLPVRRSADPDQPTH